MTQSPGSTRLNGTGHVLNSQGVMASNQTQGPVPDQLSVQQLQQQSHMTLDRANSPHGSEHSRYSAGPLNTSYPSPTAMGAPLHAVLSSTDMPSSAIPGLPNHPLIVLTQVPPQVSPPGAKSYPCGTCGKAFARRSDLARHERIHSGVRPHVCDWQGCGKQFIQRSALTVHQRVHTGEKPHQCERCGKPFSDSSSLARHRRIHSGKRPYKCPYANCQKTFTRRTTLTRHQNHHTGTIEDSQRHTAEILARGAANIANAARAKIRSDGEQAANQGSPLSTPSPAHSMSPSADMSVSNLQYLGNNTIPSHIRGEFQAGHAPATNGNNGFNNGMRPTSHPNGFGPPPTMEPSLEHQQAGSSAGSPHIASVGWPSPGPAASAPSPTHSAGGSGYVYPDPDPYPTHNVQAAQMYGYGAPAIRRSDSTEATVKYESRQGELWSDQ